MQFIPQHPILIPTPPASDQPPPRFCILRPGGLWTPLIPLDELPSWLEFCNWEEGFSLGMYAVSMNYIPRDKEYDVVCRHCSHTVDQLHRSASDRKASSTNVKACPPPVDSPPSERSAHGSLLTQITSLTMGYSLPVLGQPPFHALLQGPFVGVCLVDSPSNKSSLSGRSMASGPSLNQENASPPHAFGPMKMEAQPARTNPMGAATNVCAFGSVSPCCSMAPSENIRRWSSSAALTPSPHAHGLQSPENPQSVNSSRSDSVASTRSLTAAATLRLKRRLIRGSSLHTAISVTTTANGRSVVSVLKAPSIVVPSKHRRKVQLRRRRAEQKKTSNSPRSAISLLVPKAKTEQPNSATKRRDRRERMKRERKQTDRGKQPYYNKMRSPNWRPGMSKH
jgi:hypothetical protein